MKKNILIFLPLLFFLVLSGYGQVPFFQHYFLLKKNETVQVNTIFQDKDGFMWFGTNKGLFRFNGKSYHRFTAADSLPDEQITAIAQDSTGKIWTGHRNGQLATIEKDVVHTFEPAEGSATGEISDILFDRKGNLWFSTFNDGLYYTRQNRLYRLDEQEGLPDLFIYDIAEDDKGNIWAGTDGGIAICTLSDSISIRVLNHKQGLPDNIVKKIEFDGDSTVWMATEDAGIIRYDAISGKFETMQKNTSWLFGSIADFLLKDEKIWIATAQSGLVVYDVKKGTTKHYENQPGYNLPPLSVLVKDREGNVWAGSKSGIVRTAGDHLEFIESFLPSNDINVLALAVDRQESIWFSTSEGLFRRTVDSNGKVTVEKQLINTAFQRLRIISLFADDFGYIWAGLYGEGVLRIDVKTGSIKYLSKELRNGNILQITGKGNIIWLATLGGGEQITVTGSNLSIKNFNSTNGLSSDFIYQVFVDSQDRVWFATDGKGVDMMDAKGFHHIEDGLPSKVVYGFAEDAKGQLWVNVQGNGIYRLDGNKFQAVDIRSRLRDSNINAFSADQCGNLVVMHDLGIDIFNVQKNRMHYLGEEEGVRDKIATLNALSRDADGNLYFGTTGGIIRYSPNKVLAEIEPLVLIDGVKVFDQKRVLTNGQTLRYDENSLTINFLGFWFQNPSSLHFQYKVDNYDEDWISTGDNAVTYSSLPPGSYTFRVRVTDHGDFTDTSETSLRFAIAPPFWRTATFYILVILLFMLTGYSFIKYRERKLKQDKLELEAKVEQRTLEIQMKTEEIMAQNEEITAQAEEIKGINENLELIVNQRTLELEKKNRALEEYAFINAHKLRSPLASILGLINLFRKTNLDEEAKIINEHLQQRADELDEVVRSITKAIERGEK
jgi:ligand-binding sensor domain-containing protein